METAIAQTNTHRYTCPLCSCHFGGSGESCHSSCPMSRGCKMIKCPRCNYEFVEESSIVNFVRKLMKKTAGRA